MVRLNRAVALAERDGPAVGIAVVDAIGGLETYALWHATRAVLLDRLGRRESADAARAAALALETSVAVRRQILAGPAM